MALTSSVSVHDREVHHGFQATVLTENARDAVSAQPAVIIGTNPQYAIVSCA